MVWQTASQSEGRGFKLRLQPLRFSEFNKFTISFLVKKNVIRKSAHIGIQFTFENISFQATPYPLYLLTSLIRTNERTKNLQGPLCSNKLTRYGIHFGSSLCGIQGHEV